MVQIQDYTELTGFRYERKFVSENLDIFQIEQIVKLNPGLFSEIFKERHINNIYFDTPRLDFFYDNVSGKSERYKFRIRWYGELIGKIEQPVLEIKIKKGYVGTKQSYKLIPFEFSGDFSKLNFKEIFTNSDLPENQITQLLNLKPTLINRYSRKYYRDFSRDFRLTIDKNIEYYPTEFEIHKNYLQTSNQTVIELKYDVESNERISKITNHFPIRLTKNSKYVNGIQKYYNIVD